MYFVFHNIMPHPTLNFNDINQSVGPLHAAIKRSYAAFCSTTSTHGLKYTRDKDTNKKVRAIWLLIVLISLFSAIAMVMSFYVQYQNNITHMTIENYVPLETLAFPAITICPETMFNVQQTKRYLATLKFPLGSHNVQQLIRDLRVVYRFIDEDVYNATERPKQLRPTSAKTPYSNVNTGYDMYNSIKQIQNLIDYNNISTMTLMENIQWKCEDIVFRCTFQRLESDCRKLIERSKTAFGYCCSFNLNQDGLNYTGYQLLSGSINGLALILYHNDTDYGEYPSATNGFKLLVSTNNGFPGFFTPTKFVTLYRENFISMRPSETYSSESVRKLDITDRKCAFPHEFPLKHFKTNEAANCFLECRINKTLQLCGCIPYYFDSSWINETICTFSDIPCLLENFAVTIGRLVTDQCICPSHCNVVSYELELTNTQLDVGVPSVIDFYKNIKPEYSVVYIFVDSHYYARFKLDLIYNKLILISNLGSAFSLTLGMSMVSVIESIYYITIILRKFYKQEVDMRRKLQRLTFLKRKKLNLRKKEFK